MIRSLQLRLGVSLALGVIVLWSAATVVSALVVRHEIDEIHDYAMVHAARRQLALSGNDDAGVPRADDRQLPVDDDDPLDYRRQALRESITALVAPLPLLVPLSLGLVWLIVRASLGSVGRLRERIEARDESDLAPLPTDDLPSELKPIVSSVNELMGRLEQAIEAERDFASNSAHELRTPIAAALAGTQRLIAGLPDDASRERARQVERALQSLASLSAKLMQLARAESGFLVHDDIADRHEVLPHVVAEAQSHSGNADRLTYRFSGPARFMTRLDVDGLAILLRNLIENALKHSPAGSTVEIVLDGNRNDIRVINEGPVVSVEAIETSRRRFARGRTTADGAGLGLSIIDAVTRESGVVVDFRSPAFDRQGGFEALISTPQADERR